MSRITVFSKFFKTFNIWLNGKWLDSCICFCIQFYCDHILLVGKKKYDQTEIWSLVGRSLLTAPSHNC